MPLTTADIGIQLLMDSTVTLKEIEARITARVRHWKICKTTAAMLTTRSCQ